tara:strand:+ start:340 stop:603 length:264 start_codon:yes stop_codon:yes gene_type:complete
MESIYLFGFDSDMHSFSENKEVKETEKIVFNYANNNNKEIKRNHTSNIFNFISKKQVLLKYNFLMILMKSNAHACNGNYIMVDDLIN